MFDRVKRFYELGLYTRENVAAFVQKGRLTPAQFMEITGEEYV